MISLAQHLMHVVAISLGMPTIAPSRLPAPSRVPDLHFENARAVLVSARGFRAGRAERAHLDTMPIEQTVEHVEADCGRDGGCQSGGCSAYCNVAGLPGGAS